MLQDIFATKMGMSQAWTTAGKRLVVTRCRVNDNFVVAKHNLSSSQTPSQSNSSQNQDTSANSDQSLNIFEIGYGRKKMKNVSKPLRTKLEKGGFSVGVSQLKGVKVVATATEGQETKEIKVGDKVTVNDVLNVGDIVQVRGTTKGRGFAGGIKRHGFSGGPKTHGQSDRERAVGSIGAGTFPGKVWKGKKMPGHYGVDTKTVSGLVVLHIDPETNEIWLSGPVPGFSTSTIQISKTGKTRQIDLDKSASGIKEVEEKVEEEAAEVEEAQTQEVKAEEPKEEATVEEAKVDKK